MGAAMGNGVGERQQTARQKTEEKKAKMPWEKEVLLGGKGRYDESKRKRDKNGKFATKEGREWKPADAEEAGVLSRLTGLKFKAGTRIHATADGLRHAEKGHGHQLQEKDWSQLRGRLFDPRTERSMGLSGNREKVIQFNFQRGSDPMEAVFTVHPFKNPGAPGELRIKTYKKLDPRDLAARKQK